MYKQCWTEQSATRQREIEQALLQMMQSQRLEEITVSSLCSQIGIARKTFYRYYESKESAVHALVDHALMDFECQISTVAGWNNPLKQAAAMEQLFYLCIHYKPLMDALEKSKLWDLLVDRGLEHIGKLNVTGCFRDNSEKQLREYRTIVIVCGLTSMVFRWYHDGLSNSAEEMARYAMELFNQPLFTGAWSPE